MRLWHYSLIPYLPDSQLKGQWRECSLISVSLKKNNTPNHILVNRITDYGIDDYYTDCYFVEVEMNMRKFKKKGLLKSQTFLKMKCMILQFH